MKPTTAIKRIAALLEDAESDEDREALTLALRAVVDDLEIADPPQVWTWPTWVRVYPPQPRLWYDGNISISGATSEVPSQTWTFGASDYPGPPLCIGTDGKE